MFAGAGQRFVDSDGSIEEDQKLEQRNLPGGQHPRTEQDHKTKPHAHHIIRDGNRQSRQQFIQHKTGNDTLYLFAEALLIIAHGLSGAQQLDVFQILLQSRTDIQLLAPVFLVCSLGDFSGQRHHEKHHRHTYRQIQREPPVMEDLELQPEQCRALLKSPGPVADILKDFEKLELGYMGTILDCIEGRAAKMMQLEKEVR